MATSFLVILLCIHFVISSIDAKTATVSRPGLNLKKIDQEEAKGCWKDPDQAAPMCFHISSNLMRITRGPNGGIPLALYYTNKIRDIHYIQALEDGLLRYRSMDIRVPELVSSSLVIKAIKRKFKTVSLETESLSDLYFFLKQIPRSSKTRALIKKPGKRVLTENEATTLEKISSALKVHPLNRRFPKVMERFHLLCLGLVRSLGPLNSYKKEKYDFSTAKGNRVSSFYDVLKQVSANIALPSFTNQTPPKTRPQGPGDHDNGSAKQQRKRVGCTDVRSGSDRECFGMCGPRCWCWDWLCGDCCLHKGCLQHDACCRHAKPEYLSTYCLLPFIYGFDCKGYKGYPKCLQRCSYSIYA